MSKTTGIGWTDSTANAVIGCSRVSPGCVNCYAEVDNPARILRGGGWSGYEGRKIETWGSKGVRVPVKGFEKNMLAMNRRPWICEKCGRGDDKHYDHSCTGRKEDACHTANTTWHRRRIFADSNSDWLDDQWPIETLAHFLDVIRRCDQCVIQLLTKRPENFVKRLELVIAWAGTTKDQTRWFPLWEWCADWFNKGAPKHIWIGTSCEDQQRADERVPELLRIPATVRFLSCEPLLSDIDLRLGEVNYDVMCYGPGCGKPWINWVIVGGESGPNRRAMQLQWLTKIVLQCHFSGSRCFVKQDTALKPGQQGSIPDEVWKIKQFPV